MKFFVIFFLEKNCGQLKKLKIWVGGQKAISEGVGFILNARGGGHKFFLVGVAPLLLTYGHKYSNYTLTYIVVVVGVCMGAVSMAPNLKKEGIL